MNRPKKNKITNPTLPEDQQTVDERHLIDTEESAEISFEDRVRMYWMENKGFITGCITVLAVVVIVFQGMRIYAEHSKSSVRAEFNQAAEEGRLEQFARDHAGKELGGFAALRVADEKYEAGEYESAAELYGIAAEALADTVFAGRARLGHAFAVFQSGDTEAGIAELNAIAADSSLADPLRAEAAFHLAVEADVEGRDEAFEDYARQIREMSGAGTWTQRLEVYARQSR